MNSLDIQAADSGAPSELQTLIADSVERLFSRQVTPALLAGFDAGQGAEALWQEVNDNGLPHALVPEAAGGSGASWQDAAPVLRAIGYWQAPLPLAETMLAAALLARAGLEIPEGPLSLIQAGRRGDLRLSADARHATGSAGHVPWARTCRWAVIADGCRLALVDLRHTSIERVEGRNLAGEERDSLCFRETPIHAVGDLSLAGINEPVWLLGALQRACMLIGALESCLDKAVGYANERVQFGKAIGRQQALQQQLAQMAGAIGAARIAVQVALHSANEVFADEPMSAARLEFDVAVAKVCAGEAATLACSVAHQVHGSIGFTHEHSLHFATRRLWSWRDEFGSDAQWARLLGDSAIQAGSEGFWAGLVARSL